MAKKITKNYMPEIPQYNFGGWLGQNAGAIGSTTGMVLGGLVGSVVPGAGTALGASIGGSLGGALGGVASSNYQAGQTKIEQDRLKNEEMKAMRPVLSGLSPKSMYGIYAKGGGIGGEDNAIINIEKGELAIKRPEPNSRLGKIVQEFTGKNPFTGTDFLPHASKQTKEPIGNYVPTEMVKDELKADYIISKKYAQQYKDATKRKDKYTLNSILRNIDAESEMGKDPRNTQMKKGDAIPQYAGGGGFDLRDPRMGFQNTILENSPFMFNQNQPIQSPFGKYEIPKVMPTIPQFAQQPQAQLKGAFTPNVPYPGGNAPIADPGMSSLTKNAMLSSVPGAINLARGLFEKPVKQQMVSPLFNPYEGQALSKLSGRVSSQPAISELNNQRNSYMQGLRGGTSNQSIYRSNLQNLFGNSGKTAGNIVNQTRQTNLGLDAQQSQAMMNAGAQRVNAMDQARGTNLQLSQMNQQAQAAKDNMLYQGLSDIPKQQLQLNQNRDAQRMEAFKMMMLMDTFGTAQDMYNQPKYASYFNQLGIKR